MSMTSRLACLLPALLFCLPALAGPAVHYASGKEVRELDVRERLKNPPRDWSGPIHIETLGSTGLVSAHIVWVKTAEKLHYHAKHEATVTLLKGRGRLRIGGRDIPLKPGDLITLPAGTPHAFTNDSKSPAAAYVVFAPPFDGKDTIEVGEQVQ